MIKSNQINSIQIHSKESLLLRDGQLVLQLRNEEEA